MTIRNYLKERKYLIFLFLFLSILNAVTLFVYNCPLEPVLYALVIYIALLIFLGCLDFYHLNKKHKLLTSYVFSIDKNLSECFPEAGILETDYQNLIYKLEQEQTQIHDLLLKEEQENSDFYTLWVHQIKTPIAALKLLLQTSPENIPAIKNEVFKIERYVDVILGYLRMKDFHNDLLLKHYSLDTLVRQAVKKYSPLFIQSRLSLKLEPLTMSVLTDEKWSIFVIEQLLSNALKYTPNGNIHIYGKTTDKNGIIKTSLMIKDTGIGISGEDLPRIFERGFTGYNGRMDKKASGLGLYLCKTILNKLGHEISITSLPQKGTCVTIHFTELKQ